MNQPTPEDQTLEFNIQNPIGTIVTFKIADSLMASWTEKPAENGAVKLWGFWKPIELRRIESLGERIYDTIM